RRVVNQTFKELISEEINKLALVSKPEEWLRFHEEGFLMHEIDI
ncbi:unnamed protein product, partial [Oikopleura dioica]